MSLQTKIPPHSNFIPVSVRFKATYNAVTPWRYDFTKEVDGSGNLLNKNVLLYNTKADRVYLIERRSMTFTIPSEEYTAAIGANEEPFQMLQLKKQHEELIYTKPWRVNAFTENNESVIYFDSNQNDQLVATFQGQLNQTANMIQFPVVYAIFTANLYEIKNQKWMVEYDRGTTPDTGKSLNE